MTEKTKTAQDWRTSQYTLVVTVSLISEEDKAIKLSQQQVTGSLTLVSRSAPALGQIVGEVGQVMVNELYDERYREEYPEEDEHPFQ